MSAPYREAAAVAEDRPRRRWTLALLGGGSFLVVFAGAMLAATNGRHPSEPPEPPSPLAACGDRAMGSYRAGYGLLCESCECRPDQRLELVEVGANDRLFVCRCARDAGLDGGAR